MSRKDITEVRKGLLMIRTIFETEMKSRAKISNMNPKQEPITLMKTNRAISLSTLKGEFPLKYKITPTHRHAISDL